MSTMRDLLEARARTAAAMREIVDHPEDAGDLSADQEQRFETLKGELAATEARIERQAIIDEADRRVAGTPLTAGDGDDRFAAQCRGFSLQRAIASQIDARSVDAGREIEVSQELARRSGQGSRGIRVPLGALVPMERRVQSSSGDAGYLIADDFLANEFVDALRPATVVGALGGRMLTGLRGDIVIPKMDALTPAAEWVAEGSALSGGDHSFTQLTGTPKHVGLLTSWSRKVMLQANPAIEQLVRSDFVAKLAAAVDLGAMKGSGTEQPVGITGTGSIGNATGLADYGDVIDVVAKVEAANVPMASLGWAGNAWVKAKLKQTLKSSGDTTSNFVMGDDNSLGGYPYRTSSQLAGTPGISPASGGEAIFAAWNQLITCFWGDAGADILVNPYASTSYEKGEVLVRAFVDVDVVVRYPAAFVHVSAIDIG